ncbi:ABC transporter permease [Microlunatus speluncae]|uniref:ABC transporter permease n=1 Tax=Microlunatus speluncae TaxID=2594267 RepID=UPI0012662E2D|nr:ABC transporter permease [Microlunatus speluncae]
MAVSDLRPAIDPGGTLDPRAPLDRLRLAAAVAPPRRRSASALIGAAGYLGRRLLIYLGVAAVATVLNFFLPRLMPGDPVRDYIQATMNATGRPPSGFELRSLEVLYGKPDENLLIAFGQYLGELAQGNFGLSTSSYPTPVTEMIAQALPWTMVLGFVVVIGGWVIGTAGGAVIGWRPGSKPDSVLTPVIMFFHSIPSYWLALVFIWYFAYRNSYFPAQGAYGRDVEPTLSDPAFLPDAAYHAALPLFVTLVLGFAGWMFAMRNMMINTTNEDFVVLARAKGLPHRDILFRYAARNAMLPNVTGLAQAFGGILMAIVFIETTFAYPGVGLLFNKAIFNRDYPLMQTLFLMATLSTLIFNFLADSVYVLLDPRTREER